MVIREFDEQTQTIQQMLRAYCDEHIAPRIDALEDGEILPYELMRHMADTFGLREMVGGGGDDSDEAGGGDGELGRRRAVWPGGRTRMLGHVVMMELSRVSPRAGALVRGEPGADRGHDRVAGHARAAPALGKALVSRWTRSAPGG